MTQPTSQEHPPEVPSTVTQSITDLTRWFITNYLKVIEQTPSRPQSLITYETTDVQPTFKILGVTLNLDLSFKPHFKTIFKKIYAKIAALRRIRPLIPFKSYVIIIQSVCSITSGCCSPLLKLNAW